MKSEVFTHREWRGGFESESSKSSGEKSGGEQ